MKMNVESKNNLRQDKNDYFFNTAGAKKGTR
jgi:hypothetical protein